MDFYSSKSQDFALVHERETHLHDYAEVEEFDQSFPVMFAQT